MIQETATVAGTIIVVASALLALILKARKMSSRDNRDIKYDEGQARWVKSLQDENIMLRREKDELWQQRIEDIRKIEELKASDRYLRQELASMVRKLDTMTISMTTMEASMLAMRRRLKEIDKTAPPSDYSPLT